MADEDVPLRIYDELQEEFHGVHQPHEDPEPLFISEPETGWLPPVAEPSLEFIHDDGTVYERIDHDMFPLYDEVDSTTIVDDGEPDAR